MSTVTQAEDEQAWLKQRTKGIGGSDIGTICGVNNFSTPRVLYLSKLGMYEDDADSMKAASERMHFGHVLEPIVADEFALRTGKKVAVSPATYVHRDVSWALANIDRFIVDDNGLPIGLLECKTSSEYFNAEWNEGDVPISYLYQVLWYMYVTGLRVAYLATLVGGNKFYYFEIPYNEDIVNEILVPAATHFWEVNIKGLVEPDLDGSEASTAFAKKTYSSCIKNSEITFTAETTNELANMIVDTKLKIKVLEKALAEAENRIKDMMKEHEIAYTADRIIKWSPRMQQRVNTDVLKSSYPQVYEACKKTIEFRVFTVK